MLKGDRVECSIPSYRLDLNIEVDLVEEVARVVGYDKVPVRDEIAPSSSQACVEWPIPISTRRAPVPPTLVITPLSFSHCRASYLTPSVREMAVVSGSCGPAG